MAVEAGRLKTLLVSLAVLYNSHSIRLTSRSSPFDIHRKHAYEFGACMVANCVCCASDYVLVSSTQSYHTIHKAKH